MSNRSEPAYISRKKPFAIALRRLMDETEPKTTQSELAEALGLKRQTISLYANGQSVPDIEKLQDIAGFFRNKGINVSYEFLLGESQNIEQRNVDIGAKIGLTDMAIQILRDTKKLADAEIEAIRQAKEIGVDADIHYDGVRLGIIDDLIIGLDLTSQGDFYKAVLNYAATPDPKYNLDDAIEISVNINGKKSAIHLSESAFLKMQRDIALSYVGEVLDFIRKREQGRSEYSNMRTYYLNELYETKAQLTGRTQSEVIRDYQEGAKDGKHQED